ncbi:MAG: hypothetical protein ABI583_10105 [Betaproteobacteria bacterium]
MDLLMKKIVVLVSLISMVGCTSLQPVSYRTGAASTSAGATELSKNESGPRLALKDDVIIHMAGGKLIGLRISAVNADSIEGIESGKAETTRVPIGDIDGVERHDIDGPKTTLLIIALLALIAGYALAAGTGKLLAATAP